MAGIYIPGMEMPDRCFACPMCETDCCGISHGSYIEYREVDVDVAMNGRPDWCPLIPAADVRPVVHGRWKNGHCSHCGEDVASRLDFWTSVQRFLYCPFCGALMDKGGDGE